MVNSVYTVHISYIQYIQSFNERWSAKLNIFISNSSSKPIYTQIVEQVKRQILTGNLEDGFSMPSIRMLAKELHVSVITTKNAYQELENEGLLHSVQGKGFYVSAQKKELLREKKMELIEGKLEEVIEEAKGLGITLEELVEIMKLIY